MPLEAFPTIPAEELRRRSVSNLLRMGHCAPTVMQTMLDASDTEGVHAYIEHDGTTECARIARLVAERVAEMVAEAS